MVGTKKVKRNRTTVFKPDQVKTSSVDQVSNHFLPHASGQSEKKIVT